jgi:hypothetical protein
METASAKQELLLSKLVLEKQVFAVLIYICVWFEGFLFCRFAVLCVIRFIWAGGILPRDPTNKSGGGSLWSWSFRDLLHSMDVFSMMMILWHKCTKIQAGFAANKFL